MAGPRVDTAGEVLVAAEGRFQAASAQCSHWEGLDASCNELVTGLREARAKFDKAAGKLKEDVKGLFEGELTGGMVTEGEPLI